jgi:hypothetical protein
VFLRLLAVLALADGTWAITRPGRWAHTWGRFVTSLADRPVLARSFALIELGFGLYVLLLMREGQPSSTDQR